MRHKFGVFLLALILAGVLAVAGCSSSDPVTGNGPQTSSPQSGDEPKSSAVPTPLPESEPAPEPAVSTVRAEVVRVVDGDTAVFKLHDGAEEKVRFIGVDTPESTNEVEAYGKEASNYTADVLTPGRIVFLEEDVEQRDRYGRLLAYVWLSEPKSLEDSEVRSKLFNAQLALDGYAQSMTIQPNSKYASKFAIYVAEARSADRGLWSPAVIAADEAASEPAPKPAPAPVKKKKSESTSPTVYITDTGEKYHSDGCQYLRKSRHSISLKDAKNQGYSPCSRCGPPD